MLYMFVWCLLAAPTKLWLCEIAKIPLNNKRRNFKNVCAKCEAKNAKNVCEECMYGDVFVYAMDTIEPSNKQSIHIYIVTAMRLSARVLLWQPFVATFCCWPSVCAIVVIGKPLKVLESVGYTHTHTQVWALQICIWYRGAIKRHNFLPLYYAYAMWQASTRMRLINYAIYLPYMCYSNRRWFHLTWNSRQAWQSVYRVYNAHIQPMSGRVRQSLPYALCTLFVASADTWQLWNVPQWRRQQTKPNRNLPNSWRT